VGRVGSGEENMTDGQLWRNHALSGSDRIGWDLLWSTHIATVGVTPFEFRGNLWRQ